MIRFLLIFGFTVSFVLRTDGFEICKTTPSDIYYCEDGYECCYFNQYCCPIPTTRPPSSPSSSSSSGLSAGAIVGIVIGSIVFLICCGVCLRFCLKNEYKSGQVINPGTNSDVSVIRVLPSNSGAQSQPPAWHNTNKGPAMTETVPGGIDTQRANHY